MAPMLDRLVHRFAAGSRRQVLRGLLGTAAAALGSAVPRGLARATAVASYCADTPEQEFLRLINDYRVANNLGRLSLGEHIGAAAQHHSTDMADRNYLSHTTQGSSDGPRERMIAHGYPANTTWWGENIYAGYGTQNGVDLGSAQAAFNWWKNSPGHNANMLGSHYVVIGIDRASNPNSQYRNYWTTDFGGVTDQAATLCGGGSPSPSPTRLTIAGHQQSSNSTNARQAYDGDAATAWRTTGTGTPTSAWVQFDLGSTQALGEIRWQFSQLGFADQFTIQVSSDGTTWQTLATRGNAPAASAWETLATTASGRYVRFSFANPNRDRRLGFLSEVQVYGASSGLRSADVTAAGARDDDAKQAGPPAISSEDAPAERSGDRSRKQRRREKRRRQGRTRR